MLAFVPAQHQGKLYELPIAGLPQDSNSRTLVNIILHFKFSK